MFLKESNDSCHSMCAVTVNTSLPHFFLTSAQIRAARSLIRWTAEDLAAASALSVATIRRAELKENQTALTSANDLSYPPRVGVSWGGVHRRELRGPGCPAAEAAAEKRLAQGVIANAGFRHDGYRRSNRSVEQTCCLYNRPAILPMLKRAVSVWSRWKRQNNL